MVDQESLTPARDQLADAGPPTYQRSRYDGFISYSHALDGRLAPAVQHGLARFAKSWRRMRALRIFRDETNLSASPALWSLIERAMDESEFFILFASRHAASSSWVGRELEHWLQHRSPDRVLIVLTEGSLVWDDHAADFDWTVTDSLPAAARGRFVAEPRYVDMRWAREEEELSLQHPRFRDAIADLAATIQGRPKDELIGEDVRQHRRTVRLARSVIAALTTFALLVSVLGVAAWSARNTAERERQLATSRYLSAAAVNSLPRHLDRAALLSVAASAVQDTAESRDALLRSVQWTPDALRYLRAAGPEIADVAVSRDGRLAAAVDHDGRVAVWDVRSGRAPVPAVTAHDGFALAVAFSPDSRLIATGGSDSTVAIWDAASLTLVRRLVVADPAVRSLAFSPDGDVLAAGGGAATYRDSLRGWAQRTARQIEIFRTADWTNLGALTGHVGAVEGIRFSADGGRIFSANIDFDSGVGWWDTGTWTGSQEAFPEQLGTNSDVGVSPDGTRIAVASNLTSTVLVWDVQTDTAVARLTGLSGHISGLDHDPRGDLVAAATYDGEIGVWSSSDPARPVRRLAGHDRNIEGGGTVVAFGPDGMLVSGSSGGAVVLHDVDVTTRLVTDVLPATPSNSVGDVVGNEHGMFAFASSGSPLQLWDMQTRRTSSIPFPAGTKMSSGSTLSPDGTGLTVAVDGGHGTFALLDTRAGQLLWRADEDPIGAAFSPDGSTVAVVDKGGEVRLLDATTGARTATLPAQPPVPEELARYADLDLLEADEAVLAFTPDGTHLAVAGPDGPVWLWNVGERRLSAPGPLLGHGRVYAMALSPNGEILATGGADEQIRVWDVGSGELIGLMSERPEGRVYGLLFSPDGRTLVSSAPEHELWDVETRRRIGDPIDVSDPWNGMAVTADGSELVVVGPDGDVSTVTTRLESWIDIACGIANRDLSVPESEQFLDGTPAPSCTR